MSKIGVKRIEEGRAFITSWALPPIKYADEKGPEAPTKMPDEHEGAAEHSAATPEQMDRSDTPSPRRSLKGGDN